MGHLAPRSWIRQLFLGLAIALPSTAAAEPSHWSDSERAGDLLYFGTYGGVSFASVPRLAQKVKSGGIATAMDVRGPVSFATGYQMTFWPYEFVGFDMHLEVFGL